jgi:hypothetical protein
MTESFWFGLTQLERMSFESSEFFYGVGCESYWHRVSLDGSVNDIFYLEIIFGAVLD